MIQIFNAPPNHNNCKKNSSLAMQGLVLCEIIKMTSEKVERLKGSQY